MMLTHQNDAPLCRVKWEAGKEINTYFDCLDYSEVISTFWSSVINKNKKVNKQLERLQCGKESRALSCCYVRQVFAEIFVTTVFNMSFESVDVKCISLLMKYYETLLIPHNPFCKQGKLLLTFYYGFFNH